MKHSFSTTGEPKWSKVFTLNVPEIMSFNYLKFTNDKAYILNHERTPKSAKIPL